MKTKITKLVLLLFALLTTGSVSAATETYDFKGIAKQYVNENSAIVLTNEADANNHANRIAWDTNKSIGVYKFSFSGGNEYSNDFNNRFACATGKFSLRHNGDYMGLWNQGSYDNLFAILDLTVGDKVTITQKSGETSYFKYEKDYSSATLTDVADQGTITSGTEYTISTAGNLVLRAPAAGIHVEKIVIETSVATETITIGGTTETYNFGAIASGTTFTTAGAASTTITLGIEDNNFNDRFSLGTDSRNISFGGANYGLQMIYQNRGLFINNLKEGDQVKLTFTTENSQVLKFVNGGNVGEAADATVESGKWYTVTTAGQLQTTNSANGGSDKTNITEVQIKTINESVTAGTLVSTKALDFTGSSVSAYYASSASAGSVTFTQINKVAAGTPIYIKAAAGKYEIPALDGEADATTGNLLKGSASATTSLQSDGDTKYYVFGVKGGEAGFYPVSTSSTLTSAAGKAYLQLTAAQAAASARINMIFDEGSEPTGINDVRSQKKEVRGEYYDLSGRRVVQPTRGLYIVNGKKVIIK